MGVVGTIPGGGLSQADKQTVHDWMIEGHSVQNGKVQGKFPIGDIKAENIRDGVTILGVPGNLGLKRVRVATAGEAASEDTVTVNMKRLVPAAIWPTLTRDNFAFSSVSYRIDGNEVENDDDYRDDKGPTSGSISYDPSKGTLTVYLKRQLYDRIFTGARGYGYCTVTVDCFYLDSIE